MYAEALAPTPHEQVSESQTQVTELNRPADMKEPLLKTE